MEGEKIKVVYFASENSGVGYYRFWQPLENLKERGLIELKGWGFDWTNKDLGQPSLEELKEFCDWGDIFIFGRKDVPDWQNMIKTVKEFTKKPVLLDIDDNIFSVSPYVGAYMTYQPNGLPMKLHEETAKYVDGVICSTEALSEIYKKYNKTWIVPNGVRYIHPKMNHEGVNIGYMVSGSHLENSQIIEPAVINVLRKFNNVRFFYTKAFQGFMDRIPKEIESQVSYVPFYPLKDYYKYVNQLKLDIALAPLMDNDFNRSKSNIRVLESWQQQSAVIASPLPEYSKTITHGFDGYISQNDEWEYWLTDLIINPERRNYLVNNSKETLKKYDVSNFADIYMQVLRELTNG